MCAFRPSHPNSIRNGSSNGHIERVIRLAEAWVNKQPVRGLKVEIVRLPGRTPLLYFDVPATGKQADRTVLLYGHLDKQPEMSGWRDGYGPWDPLFENGKLYGRGSADDGYAVFAALSAIRALQAQDIAHSHCVGMIETCEESGSYDLPAYLEALAPRMGRVDFVIGLDSGCGDYDRMWDTTSLRGLVEGSLTVERVDRGRAFGRRQRCGALLVPYRAQAARSARGRDHRARAAAGVSCPDSGRARRAGAACGAKSWARS